MIALLAGVALGAEADVPFDHLCDGAELVAVAEVTSTETFWTEGPEGGIATRFWLAVESVVKGPKAETVSVVLPGGTLDGITLWVSDLPELGVDRTFVVLLAPKGDEWAPAVGSRSAVAVARHPRERLPAKDAVIGALRCD